MLASSRKLPAQEVMVAIRFYGKEGSDNTSCPSVSVDDRDGSFIFVGWPVNDPDVIAEVETYSHIEEGEKVFRIPNQLRKAIWEACGGHDPSFD